MASNDVRQYPCIVERVVEYNLIDVSIDLGFGVFLKRRVRLVNVPEIEETEVHRRFHAAEFVKRLLFASSPQKLYCYDENKDGPGGWCLGDFMVAYIQTGNPYNKMLSKALKSEGHT